SGGLTINAPANTNYAPPGYYMLFLLNSKGVPSVAKIVQVTANADTTPPSAPSNLSGSVSGSTVTLSWTASTDNVGVTGYTVNRPTPSGFTPSASTQIGTSPTASYSDNNLAVGTYYYLVTAQDAAGNVSAASNQASATVADTTPPSAPMNLFAS